MILNIQKFKREITGLKRLKAQSELHPLTKAAIKQKVLAEINSPAFAMAAPARVQIGFKRKFVHFLAPIGAGLLVCAGTVMAAGGAFPGDKLYPVKQAKEQVEFQLAAGETAKAKVRGRHAEERIKELRHILLSSPQQENQTVLLPAVLSSQPEATASPAAAPPKTRRQEEISSENKKIRVLREQAKTQYKEAMASLNQAKQHLEEKGDAAEAKNLTQNISQLKDKARLIKLEDDDEKKPDLHQKNNND